MSKGKGKETLRPNRITNRQRLKTGDAESRRGQDMPAERVERPVCCKEGEETGYQGLPLRVD